MCCEKELRIRNYGISYVRYFYGREWSGVVNEGRVDDDIPRRDVVALVVVGPTPPIP